MIREAFKEMYQKHCSLQEHTIHHMDSAVHSFHSSNPWFTQDIPGGSEFVKEYTIFRDSIKGQKFFGGKGALPISFFLAICPRRASPTIVLT